MSKTANERGPRSVPSDVVRRLQGSGLGTGPGGGYYPGAGAPPGAASGAPRASTPQRTQNIPPPWVVRPPMSREINIDASGTGYNNVTTPAVIVGSAFTVPPDNVGILRSVVLNVNGMLATSQLQWSFRTNGNPVEGWNALTMFPRAAGSVSIAYGPDETFIRVPLGATIDVFLTVDPADGATYQAGITYHGWHYPKRIDDLFETLYQF